MFSLGFKKKKVIKFIKLILFIMGTYLYFYYYIHIYNIPLTIWLLKTSVKLILLLSNSY